MTATLAIPPRGREDAADRPAALWPRCRPRGQGPRAARARHRRLRLRLRRDRRPAGPACFDRRTGMGARKSGGDIVATARPDILDRNGEVLATDVRTPSLFGEPRRLIDVDEAVELLTATVPDLNASETRERLSSKKGFVWLKREITKEQQQQIHRLGLPGIGFLAENKRVYPNASAVSHVIGHVNIDNQGIAGIEKWLDKKRACRSAFARLCHRPPAEAGAAFGRSARAACAADRIAGGAAEIQGQGRGRADHRRAHRRDHLDGVGARLRSERSARGARQGAHQPPHHRRLRDGLDLQGAHRRDGARFRQDYARLVLRCAPLAALRQVPDQRLSRAAPHSHGAGNLHLFVQYRHRADGAGARRRASPGVSEEDGPARPPAHRNPRKRRAAGPEALGRTQHRDHRLRSRAFGRAACRR